MILRDFGVEGEVHYWMYFAIGRLTVAEMA